MVELPLLLLPPDAMTVARSGVRFTLFLGDLSSVSSDGSDSDRASKLRHRLQILPRLFLPLKFAVVHTASVLYNTCSTSTSYMFFIFAFSSVLVLSQYIPPLIFF